LRSAKKSKRKRFPSEDETHQKSLKEFFDTLPKDWKVTLVIKHDDSAYSRISEPEKYGYCVVCKKRLSEYDQAKSQGSHCADCFKKEISDLTLKT